MENKDQVSYNDSTEKCRPTPEKQTSPININNRGSHVLQQKSVKEHCEKADHVRRL